MKYELLADADLVYPQTSGDAPMNQYLFPTLFGTPLCRRDADTYVDIQNRDAHALLSRLPTLPVQTSLIPNTTPMFVPNFTTYCGMLNINMFRYQTAHSGYSMTIVPGFLPTNSRYQLGIFPAIPSRFLTVYPFFQAMENTNKLYIRSF